MEDDVLISEHAREGVSLALYGRESEKVQCGKPVARFRLDYVREATGARTVRRVFTLDVANRFVEAFEKGVDNGYL